MVPVELGDAPPFEVGQARTLREGPDGTILAYGALVTEALMAAERLEAEDIYVSVVNARFAKPIDEAMVTTALSISRPVITVEDHSISGGFGSAVLEAANRLGLATEQILRLGMQEDEFYAHGSRGGQLSQAGIDAAGIAGATRRAVLADRADLSSRPAILSPRSKTRLPRQP
jgi:1-deoxy-D-xylulose-5-phosphate synthase